MKRRKEKNNKVTRIIIIGLVILMLSSVLGIFIQGQTNTLNQNTNLINVTLGIQILNTSYSPQTYLTSMNNSLFYFLVNEVGNIQFEQDGDMKCLGQYCNSYQTLNYWQIFINGQPNENPMTIIENNDLIELYYGEIIEFNNISLVLNMNGLLENNTLTLQKGITIQQLFNNYQASYENQTINCLFNTCNNENTSWIIKLNNETINNYNISFQQDDLLELIYE